MRPTRLALVLVLLASLPSSAAPAPEEKRWTFVAASGLDGALALAKCHARSAEREAARDLGHLAASVALARAGARLGGRKVAATVQLGDFAGAGAVGRYLVGLPDGATRLARFVGRLGFSDAILGDDFFDSSAETQAALLGALPKAGVPVLDANVTCVGGAACEALSRLPARASLEVDGLKVALVGLTGEGLAQAIDPARAAKLAIAPMIATLEAEAKAARANGADVVVALVHLEDPTALGKMLKATDELSGVDLVLANKFGDEAEATTTLEQAHGPAFVASGQTPTSVARIDVDLARAGGRWRVVRVGTTRVEAARPEASLHAEMDALVGDYCRALDQPLAARAVKPVDVEAFMAFVLDEMRRHADAEVALANREQIDASVFPLKGAVSAADVFAAMPYADTLAKATVPGSKVRALWTASKGARHPLDWAGIAEKDGAVLVNGRPLDDASSYDVALPDYLARGGDALVQPPLEHEIVREKGHALVLRRMVIEALKEAGTATAELDGTRRLDLGGRLRWTWSYGIALTGTNTHRSNKPGYTDPRITVLDAAAASGEATGNAQADARDQSVRLSAIAKYAKSAVEDAEPIETEDQLYVEALWRLKLLKRLANEAWWAPVPYVAGTLDTQFFKPDDAPFRHEELGGTVGVRLLPVTPLELKLGVGVRREMVDPNGRARFGLETGYDLPRFSPGKLNGLPIDVESGLDYFVADLAGVPQHEGRLHARVLLPLGGPLAVQAGLDVLALKTGAQAFAVLSNATLGLTVRFAGADQMF